MKLKESVKDVLILIFFYSVIIFGTIAIPKRLAWIEQQKKTDSLIYKEVQISQKN